MSMPVRACYINLLTNQARRSAMEAQLQRLDLEGLQRLDATPAGLSPTRGAIGATEQACFESHLRALELVAQPDGFGLVLEDDALLSDALPAVLAQPAVQAELARHDLVLLECQPDTSSPMLASLWASRQRRLGASTQSGPRQLGGIDLMEARGLYRWGAVAYVVSPRGAQRLPALLRAAFDQGPAEPYDITLRRLIERGDIQAAVMSPFLATAALDSHASSDIAPGARLGPHDVLGAALRRLFFAGPPGELERFVDPFRYAALTDDSELRLLADLVAQLFILTTHNSAR